MKVKSFRDLETYIYTSIVLPLKGLNLPSLDFQSPMISDTGNRWEFYLQKTPVRGEFRRNYQRNLAQQNRNYWIVLKTNEGEYPKVIGEYNIRSHWVKLWSEPFKEAGAMPVFGKLYEALDSNTPFTKVIVEHSDLPEYEHNEPFVRAPRVGFRSPFPLERDDAAEDSIEMPF